MIAESFLIIVLLSYGACKPRIDGISGQCQSHDIGAYVCGDSGCLPVDVVPLYQDDSDYLSCNVSLASNHRSSFRLNRIQCSAAGTRNTALNFLSTRLIL
jgi:hypothetical protein